MNVGTLSVEQILKIMYPPQDLEQAMQNLFCGTVEQLRVAEVTKNAALYVAQIAAICKTQNQETN